MEIWTSGTNLLVQGWSPRDLFLDRKERKTSFKEKKDPQVHSQQVLQVGVYRQPLQGSLRPERERMWLRWIPSLSILKFSQPFNFLFYLPFYPSFHPRVCRLSGLPSTCLSFHISEPFVISSIYPSILCSHLSFCTQCSLVSKKKECGDGDEERM